MPNTQQRPTRQDLLAAVRILQDGGTPAQLSHARLTAAQVTCGERLAAASSLFTHDPFDWWRVVTTAAAGYIEPPLSDLVADLAALPQGVLPSDVIERFAGHYTGAGYFIRLAIDTLRYPGHAELLQRLASLTGFYATCLPQDDGEATESAIGHGVIIAEHILRRGSALFERDALPLLLDHWARLIHRLRRLPTLPDQPAQPTTSAVAVWGMQVMEFARLTDALRTRITCTLSDDGGTVRLWWQSHDVGNRYFELVVPTDGAIQLAWSAGIGGRGKRSGMPSSYLHMENLLALPTCTSCHWTSLLPPA